MNKFLREESKKESVRQQEKYVPKFRAKKEHHITKKWELRNNSCMAINTLRAGFGEGVQINPLNISKLEINLRRHFAAKQNQRLGKK